MAATNPIVRQEAITAERQNFIGGSDIHHLFNLPPYGCELALFKKKTGVTPDIPFFGNSATDRGNRWEKLAGDVYAEKTRRDIRRTPGKVHPKLPYFVPHPDFEIVNDARGPEWGTGLLSVKVPGREMYFKMRQQGKPEDAYILQLQAELSSYNRKWGSFAIYWADGDALMYWDIDRDGEIISTVETKVAEFWAKREAGKAPEKLDPKSKQCKKCEFRITCQSEHLLKLLDKDETGGQLVQISGLDEMVEELREAEELKEEAEELVDARKDKIRAAMDEHKADVAEGEYVRVYNRLQAGRKTFQAEAFFKKFPDLHDEREKFTNLGQPFRVLRPYDKIKRAAAQ